MEWNESRSCTACNLAVPPRRRGSRIIGGVVRRASWVLLLAIALPTASRGDAGTPASPATQRAWGPLSVSTQIAGMPQAELERAWRRNEKQIIDEAAIHADLVTFVTVVNELLARPTPEQQSALEYTREHADLERWSARKLGPRTVMELFGTVASIGHRTGICALQPGTFGPCHHYEVPRPPPATAPYELHLGPNQIARLTLHALSDAAHPAWAGFAADVERLARAKGLVIDMRTTAGGDPRPLIPWLERLTGRAPLAPLREIRRPAALLPAVEAYRERFLTESRDPGVWHALVGTAVAPPSKAPRPPPIAVVVGRNCGPACELVARVLETWAGATVVGRVEDRGRLHRDDPAVLTLSSSKIELYFLATEYLLSAEIEAKTGPTSLWSSPWDDYELDGTAYATREVERRASSPRGWPARCDSHPASDSLKALPARFRLKIQNAFYLERCPWGTPFFKVVSELPSNPLRRFLATCSDPPMASFVETGSASFAAPKGKVPYRFLTQLAQSEVVKSIWATCDRPLQPY
jgi:hypothetical protein